MPAVSRELLKVVEVVVLEQADLHWLHVHGTEP